MMSGCARESGLLLPRGRPDLFPLSLYPPGPPAPFGQSRSGHRSPPFRRRRSAPCAGTVAGGRRAAPGGLATVLCPPRPSPVVLPGGSGPCRRSLWGKTRTRWGSPWASPRGAGRRARRPWALLQRRHQNGRERDLPPVNRCCWRFSGPAVRRADYRPRRCPPPPPPPPLPPRPPPPPGPRPPPRPPRPPPLPPLLGPGLGLPLLSSSLSSSSSTLRTRAS